MPSIDWNVSMLPLAQHPVNSKLSVHDTTEEAIDSHKSITTNPLSGLLFFSLPHIHHLHFLPIVQEGIYDGMMLRVLLINIMLFDTV